MDIKSKSERSRNMAAIKGKNTKPEIYMRKLLFHRGYRYSIAPKAIPGHPDIYLRRYNTAIFVNGCFWHHHPGCQYAYVPKSRVDFWKNKFEANIKRDLRVKEELEKSGIKQIVVWECTLKRMKRDPVYERNIIHQIEQSLACKQPLYLEL